MGRLVRLVAPHRIRIVCLLRVDVTGAREVAMKVRACVMVAAMAAGLCWSPAARAQEAAKPEATPPVAIVDAARFFTAPRSLGDAWERAVQAVLDGMRAFLEADRAAAQKALVVAPPPKRVPAWYAPLPGETPKPAAEPGTRQVRKVRPVAFRPVSVDPVTQTGVDARGQQAILLGAVVELPWTVP